MVVVVGNAVGLQILKLSKFVDGDHEQLIPPEPFSCALFPC